MSHSVQALGHDHFSGMRYQIAEWRETPGGWTVEAIGDDGEIYQAFFYGPEAKERAEEYAAFKSAQ